MLPYHGHRPLKKMSTDINDRVKKVIAEQFGLKQSVVTDEKHIVNDIGADSLDQVELVMAIEDEFGIEITDDDAEKVNTVKEAVDYVAGRMAGK